MLRHWRRACKRHHGWRCLHLWHRRQRDLEPGNAERQGQRGATDLKLDKFAATTVQLKWDSDGKHLKLNDIEAILYRGKVTGHASLPVQPKETGSIDVSFDNVDLGELATSLPPLPVRLEGRADGTIKATLPAETAAGQATWQPT